MTLSTQENTDPNQLPEKPISIVEKLINVLRSELGQERYEMWFSHSEPVVNDAANHRVTFQADNEFSIRRIQQSFGAEIRQTVNRVCGPQTQILFLVAQDDCAELEDVAPQGDVQQSIPFGGSEDYAARSLRRVIPTLRTFQFPPESKLLKGAVAQLFESPGQYSPLLVYGPTGSGKSHLLEGMVLEFRRRLRLKRCVYVTAEQFTTEFVGSLRQTGLPVFRRKFRDLDLLAIDDIQFLAGKKATLDEFQQTLDNLIRTGKQVILSSDRSAMELGELGADICARISAGLCCSTMYPDLEGRINIAKTMCQVREFSLPTSVLEMVCEKLPRDVRRISGAINRLQAYAATFGDKITIEFAHEVLQDLFSMTGPSCTSMVSIEKAVCEFCRVKPNELKSSSRQKRISTARMLAMYLSREYTGSAFSEIGAFFGGRSHSTVIAAQKKVEKWLDSDERLTLPHASFPAKEAVRRLESNLRIG
ncbi:MAG: DnaA/Hda family protein [Planctomycetota bacterium]